MIHTDNTATLYSALAEIERLKAEANQLMENGVWQATQISALIDERDAYKAQHDEQVTLVLELAAERDALRSRVAELKRAESFQPDWASYRQGVIDGKKEAGAAPAPEGWQLVPMEPTPEMKFACVQHILPGDMYKAMLAAAPKEAS